MFICVSCPNIVLAMQKLSVVFLAGGYGTRLISDVTCLDKDSPQFEQWQYLLDIPKCLIRIGGQPLMTRWIQYLVTVADMIDSICVVTNDKYYQHLEQWRQDLNDVTLRDKIVIYNNFTTCNEDRLGSVVDLQHGVNIVQGDRSGDDIGPVLVVAGDTIFSAEFCLKSMVDMYQDTGDTVIIAAPCEQENVSKHGIIEMDSNCKVTTFLEKPCISQTNSRTQSPCCYMLSPSAVGKLEMFLNDHPSKKDSIGSFIQHLVDNQSVFAFPVEKRFDLGNLQSCIEADKYFHETIQ